jgi:hypothetical protein
VAARDHRDVLLQDVRGDLLRALGSQAGAGFESHVLDIELTETALLIFGGHAFDLAACSRTSMDQKRGALAATGGCRT